MRKSTTATRKSNGWMTDEQLPIDNFFSSKGSTSRSQVATADKGKRKKSVRGGEERIVKKARLSVDGTPSREAIHRGARQISTETSDPEVLKEGRRKSLDDITTIVNERLPNGSRKCEQSYPTPSLSRRCRSAKEVTEIPESSDDTRFNSDPVLEPTPSKAPAANEPARFGHISQDRLSLFSSTSKRRGPARVGAPLKMKIGVHEITEVPESSDDARLESDSVLDSAPYRTPASRQHAEDALPTPPASSIHTENRPALSRVSDCGTPFSRTELPKLRFGPGIATKTPMAPPVLRANSYPTPESLAIPRLAFPKIQHVQLKQTDGDLRLPPSSPVEPGNQFIRSSPVESDIQLPVVKAPVFSRPPTPDHAWEVLSSQSQGPLYSPRKSRKPAPLFIEGSSSSKATSLADRDVTVPTSQEEEDEMVWEKALLSRIVPPQAENGSQQSNHASISTSAESEPAHVHDARHFSGTIIISPAKHVPSEDPCEPTSFEQVEETPGHHNRIFKVPSWTNVLGERSTSGTRNAMNAEESSLAFNNRYHNKTGSSTETKLYDRSSQLSDADIPSSITVPESWDDNPFPSLTDSLNTEDDALEPHCSANQHQEGRNIPFRRRLNAFLSCTQSSATQMDSDDEDPFPMLPASAEKSCRDLSSQRQSCSPKRRGKKSASLRQDWTSESCSMPDFGSFDDELSMSAFTPRKVSAALKPPMLSAAALPENHHGIDLEQGMGQQSLSVVKAFFSIFEEGCSHESLV